MWVALAIDLYVFLCRLFEIDDGTSSTSLLIECAFGLMYFVAFVILLVSWIKCSDSDSLFCQNRYRCYVHVLPTFSALLLTILFLYQHVDDCFKQIHQIY